MKKILIDCRTLEHNMRGIGFFLKSLLLELSMLDSKNIYYLFCNNKAYIKDKSGLGKNFIFIEKSAPFGISDVFIIPWIVNFKVRPDVVWFPANNCSPFINKNINVISTIHDIMFFTQKYKLFSKQWVGSLYRKLFTNIAIKRANYINTPTKYNIDLISSFFSVDKDRFFFTYESIPEPNYEEVEDYKNELTIEKPFFYTIAGTSPNKNLDKILQAFQKFNKNKEFQLIITGTKDFKILSDDIIFTGYIDNNMKHTLLKGTKLFLFLSRDEGFGIPPLEAIHHNCNILMTYIPVLNELYFDVATFTDKDNIIKIADGMESAIVNQKHYNKEKVLQRFNWNDSAKILLGKFYE